MLVIYQYAVSTSYFSAAKSTIVSQIDTPHIVFTFSTTIKTQSFVKRKAEPSLFTFKIANITIYVLLYVDDMLLTNNSSHAIKKFITHLQTKFCIKHFNLAFMFLGIQIIPKKNRFQQSQRTYAQDLLVKVGFENAKLVTNPLSTKLNKSIAHEEQVLDGRRYKSLTSAQQYLTITHLDLTFIVNQLYQHMHDPNHAHLQQLKRILRYVKGTLDLGLHLHAESLDLTTYLDSDRGSDTNSHKLTSNIAFLLGGIPISWSSKKQTMVAFSSTEEEYRALTSATTKVLWL